MNSALFVYQGSIPTFDLILAAAKVTSTGTIAWTSTIVPHGTALEIYDREAVTDGSDGFVALWADGSDIYSRRIDSTGASVWGPTVVCDATTTQSVPRAVSDGAGGVVGVWEDRRNGATDIYLQRMSSAGTAVWTPNGVAACTAANAQNEPLLVRDSNGDFVTFWDDVRISARQVYIQKMLAATGAPQWTANGVAVTSLTSLNRFVRKIISDGQGGVIVFWYDPRNGGQSNADIYAQRFNSSGVAQWTTDGVRITPTSTGSTLYMDAVLDSSSGCVFLAWGGQISFTPEFKVQKLNLDGTISWTTANISSTINNNSTANRPVIALNGSGGCFVAWMNTAFSVYNLKLQNFSSTGAEVWTAGGLTVSTQSTGTHGTYGITPDNDGGVYIAYYRKTTGNKYTLYCQRYNSSGISQFSEATVHADIITDNTVMQEGLSAFGGASEAVIPPPAAPDSRAALENNIRYLIDDLDKDDYAISGPRMIHMMNECMHLLANRVLIEDEALATVNLVAGTYDYTLSGSPTTVRGAFLSSYGIELERMEMDQITLLYRQDSATPASSGIPAYFAIYETSAQATKIRVAPTPSNIGATTMKVRTSIIPAALTAETSTVPFSDPLLRAFERWVAAECVAVMSEKDRARRMISAEVIKDWLEYVDKAVREENWRIRVQSGATQSDIVWQEV